MKAEVFILPPDTTADDLQKINYDFYKLLIGLKDYSVVMLDPVGNVISWNAGAENLFGYDAKEIIGKNVSVFYTSADVKNGKPATNLEYARVNGRYEFEVLKCRKGGQQFYTNTILTVLLNENLSVKGFAKITRDINVSKNLQKANELLTVQLEETVCQRTAELLTANKELEAFSYSVSHDLRTPLRAISGFSAKLKKRYESNLDAEANRIIDVIVDNTKMMSQLIDDLLSFSRLVRLEIVSDDIDMKSMAQKCTGEIMQTDNNGRYSFKYLDIPSCRGDAGMLKQIWSNLIGNAIKYTSKKEHPIIEIGSVPSPDVHTYYIKDNGVGFDMKYANKLFGVFQRLHRQNEFEGTGLGLALACRIINKHGGKIWAESALNEGATFFFSIPIKPDHEK